jgi:hypothetical protein
VDTVSRGRAQFYVPLVFCPGSGAGWRIVGSAHVGVVEITAFADVTDAVGAPVSIEKNAPDEAGDDPHGKRGEEKGDEFCDRGKAGHGGCVEYTGESGARRVRVEIPTSASRNPHICQKMADMGHQRPFNG